MTTTAIKHPERPREYPRWTSHLVEALIMSVMPTVLFLIFFPVFYWKYGWLWPALLLIRSYTDRVAYTGEGRPSLALRRSWIYCAMRDYFPAFTRQEEPLDASKSYLFCLHPHGILGAGAWTTFITDCNGFARKNHDMDIAVATVKLNFIMPLVREYLLALGFLDASFKSLTAAFNRGRSVALVVGGAKEALDAHPGTYDLTLNTRKGFVKLALKNGAQLVPVLTFGENNVFNQVSNPRGSILRRLQTFLLSKMTFSMPLFYGVGLFGFPVGYLPNPTPFVTVVGKPIEIKEKIDNPTKEQINKLHAEYVKELIELFDKYKDKYDPDRKSDLRLVD